MSRGRALSRLSVLQEQTKYFFERSELPLAEFLLDEMWLGKLAYLVNRFDRLNKLDISLQGFCTNIFVLRSKTDAFK